MGVDPAKVEYLRRAAEFGHVEASRIHQRGESLAHLRTDYDLLPDFRGLRLAASWS
jgi:hypothetical protein